MFGSDRAIENFKEDRLNRVNFSKQLAHAILAYAGQDNFTISLCGKWGTGKTSVINMVIEEIDKTSSINDKPIIVKFNPWNYYDKNQLVGQFFKTIMSEIGINSSNKGLKKVGSALEKYSGVLEYSQYIPILGEYLKPLKGIVKGIGKKASEVAKQKDSLENVKLEVVNALKNQNQKIIVIIDDIDRLNNEQIRLIFQLVNCVAGFPNMIYLLSFDKSVVVRALEEEQKCNGEEYLEKIIQVPFDIPEAKSSDIHSIFFEKLDELYNNTPYNDFDSKYWNNVFSNCISPLINTIRDVNRVMNVYRFKYELMHSETNCIDLLAITVLQVCAPEIFEWLMVNYHRINGSPYGVSVSGVEQKKYKNDILEEFKKVYENPSLMLSELGSIFPKLAWLAGEYYGYSETEDELRRTQRIACPERTHLYLRLTLDEVTVSRELIDESISKYDSDQLDQMFIDLIKKEKIVQYFKELNSYLVDIPDERKQMFIEKLINLQTMSVISDLTGKVFITPSTYCQNCCWGLFRLIGHEKSYKLLIYMLNHGDEKVFSILIGIIVCIDEAYGRIEGTVYGDYKIITEEYLDEIEKVAFEILKRITSSKFLYSIDYPWDIKNFWIYKNKKSYDEHMKISLEKEENVPYYLYAYAINWSSGRSRGWNFNAGVLSKYITLDALYELTLKLKNTNYFEQLDINIKRPTVAFCIWYKMTDEERQNGISEAMADSEIEKW